MILTLEDKEIIIDKFITDDSCNINYLRLIAYFKSSNDLRISDGIKLKASQKMEEKELSFFSKNNGMEISYEVSFVKDQKELIVDKSTPLSFRQTYSKKLIKENCDTITLINNFMYMFEYVDWQVRCTFFSKQSYLGTFERLIGLHAKNSYQISVAFRMADMISYIQIVAYYNELEFIGINLENVFEDYFSSYIASELKFKGFQYNPSENGIKYLTKCKNVFPEMESILKQFKLFVENGEINPDLFGIASNPIEIQSIPSLLHKKYLYGNGEEYSLVSYYFFSDQCMLSFNERFKGREYGNFYLLISSETVYQSDYLDYRKSDMEWLLEHNYLYIDAGGKLLIRNKLQIEIIKDLYFNEFISYWHYENRFQKCADDMLSLGLLTSEDRLFSRQEADYMNYYLNQSKFCNGFDLRNKYVHGTQSYGSDKLHEQNYFIALKLLALIILKINDEFCLYLDWYDKPFTDNINKKVH